MWHLDTWPNNQCWRKRFLFTGSQPWGAESTPALPQNPAPPLLLKRPQAKTMPRSSPYPYLFLSQLCKQSSIPLECALVGFRVTILLQQPSASGSGVCFSQSPCSGLGKHVPCYTQSWWSPRKHMCQDRGLSVHPPEKQKSAFPVTVQSVLR